MDEVDSIGSARSESGGGGGGDSEVQRTMLELLNQLDGFEATNKIKVGVFQHIIEAEKRHIPAFYRSRETIASSRLWSRDRGGWMLDGARCAAVKGAEMPRLWLRLPYTACVCSAEDTKG